MGLFDRFRRKPVDPRAVFLAEVQAIASTINELQSMAPLAGDYGLAVKAGGEQRTVFLENLFRETREVPPEDRPAAIRRFLTQVATPPDVPDLSWEEARPLLRPVVRAPMHVGDPTRGVDVQLFCRALVPCLREHLVIDSEHTMSYVRQEDAARWGVPPEELFAAAYANMDDVRDVGVELYDDAPSPIWEVDSGDGYESSRLLLPGFLAAFADRVEGRPIAIVPHRSSLVIGGDTNPKTVLRLCQMAEREYAASPRSVSATVYTVNGEGEIVPYLRDGDDEAAAAVREAHLKFIGSEYATQKDELDQHFERTGTDVFVASYLGIRHQSRGELSYCTWVYGVLSLLPRTDLIAIGTEPDPKAPPLFVGWEDALRLVGDRLTPEPGLFPPRWRTPQEPVTPDVIAKLREVAVPV